MRYLLLFLLPLCLFAHRLNIVIYDDGDHLTLKGYYSARSVCKNCKVQIKAKGFDKVYKTSEKGLLELPKNKLPRGVMQISINGGDGHFEQMKYELDESLLAPKQAPASPDLKQNAKEHERKIVRSRPVIRLLDIGAAVGYVFGVFGVLALVFSRRRAKD